MKNISSRVLRFSRVVTAILAVFLISISISLYKSKTSPVTWLTVGVLAFVVILVNGLLYRMLKKRPDSEHLLTLLIVSYTIDRIVLALLMLLLILCDFLAYLQAKKYFKH